MAIIKFGCAWFECTLRLFCQFKNHVSIREILRYKFEKPYYLVRKIRSNSFKRFGEGKDVACRAAKSVVTHALGKAVLGTPIEIHRQHREEHAIICYGNGTRKLPVKSHNMLNHTTCGGLCKKV
jgi:hypothetical protein